ncbi:hypothetical protein F511_24843 [Dorcoceras hygrometricum]|uniref:Uncharacterized protein n=1 Tax=Dorcoceras hygrometricum TaxID=472368 RepID=A0A2Z7AMW1_9LAMI|nr:hypothetical protein F511_24843 [Dorcoceras hygrometricum]
MQSTVAFDWIHCSLRLDILRLDCNSPLHLLSCDWIPCRLDSKACDWLQSNSWFIETLDWIVKAKRCRINLCKRHRFAIAISKNYLLVNSSLRLDFLLYDVVSLLRLDVQATCRYLATAGLKPSADYDDVTDDVINAKPSADSLARRRSSLSLLFSSADSFLLITVASC